MGFLELFILHCGLPEGVHIALVVSRKCIMVYILLSNNIVTGYKAIVYCMTSIIHTVVSRVVPMDTRTQLMIKSVYLCIHLN